MPNCDFEIYGKLTEQCDEPNDGPPLQVKLINKHGQLMIGFDGYGECGADVNTGTPVLIEVWDGKLRVIVFGDINEEDPTHVIELEAARESNRKDGCPMCGKTELKFPHPKPTHCSAECYLIDAVKRR